MANSIKHLTYTVKRGGTTITSGTVPAIIAIGGSNKNYDLGGVWLTHSSPEVTELELVDGEKTITVYSDSIKTDWIEYRRKIESGEVEDNL